MQPTHTPDMQPHGQYVPDYFLNDTTPLEQGESDTALLGYFDRPLPANDNRSVMRTLPDGRDYCSTRLRRVAVRLPRITMLDGAYRPTADNDNREAHHAH